MNPIKKWNQLGLFTRIMVGFVLILQDLFLERKQPKLAFLGTILTPSADYSCTIESGL